MNQISSIERRWHVSRSVIRRLGVAATALTLLLAVSAPAALAGAPDRSPQIYPDHLDLAAGQACSFPVRLDILENNEVNSLIALRNGVTWLQTTGRLVMRIVNADTGANVTRNISGPGSTVFHDDGTVTIQLNGQSLLFWPGTLLRTSGPVVVQLDSTGNVVGATGVKANAEDLCAELG